MKVVILCGGKGIRLNDTLDFIPKGMVKIGHRPLLWHIMKAYSNHGFNEFVLALGSNSKAIRDYFLHYNENINDLTLTLGNNKLDYNTQNQEENWKITFVETGENSGTGARLFRCQKYLNDDDFLLTYSDCLSDIDINKLVGFHILNKKILTTTGVLPPFRYGEFIMDGAIPKEYRSVSKLRSQDGLVNGGFMALSCKIFDYLTPYNECVLEQDIFKSLVNDRQLSIFEHFGFWQCIDNEREYRFLNKLSEENSEFWLFKNKND
ncbi:NTP transferase domain-containing protein [Candidatus Gracilibacteria bacterium]|nr:NTP transferase domain-containing protein [Candidatus Gracilibacteria bacterium]MCF7898995.1 NTP transferase domain-containing protein [Candidatus Paceibacterota bacterium]